MTQPSGFWSSPVGNPSPPLPTTGKPPTYEDLIYPQHLGSPSPPGRLVCEQLIVTTITPTPRKPTPTLPAVRMPHPSRNSIHFS